MPPRKLKLLTSGVYSVPVISQNDIAWANISKIYGKPFPEELKAELCEYSNAHLRHIAAMLSTEPFEIAIKHLDSISKTASELLRLLGGERGKPISHAMRHANMWLGLLMSDMQQSRPRKVDFLRELLSRLINECPKVKSRLKSETARAPESAAWDLWIAGLSHVLKRHGLPANARKDSGEHSGKNKSGPSPFVFLVRELQKQIPAKFRKHVQSQHTLEDGALATAIKRAQRRYSGHERRGK
ncbi:MAG: hypothetical protein ACXWBP_12675 [Limisphaerales bacterium]